MPITRGKNAVQKREGKRPSMQAYVRCLHCNRNQSRHFSTGRGNWSCRYCSELNPGPAVSEKVIAVRRTRGAQVGAGELAQPPAGEEPAPAGAKRVTRGKATRSDRARPAPSAAPPSTQPAPGAGAGPEGAGTPAPSTPGTPPARGLWDRIAYGA